MRTRWVFSIGLLFLATWVVVEWRQRTPTPASDMIQSATVTRSVFLGTDPRTESLARLTALTWAELEPTLNQLLNDPLARDRVIDETATMDVSPVVFLRAFLLTGRGDAAAGWAAMTEVDAGEVPAAWVYAAWRLGVTTGAGPGNRFLPAARLAVTEGRLLGLPAARIQAVEGAWRASLQGYADSDPAQWTDLDGVLLAQARQLAGWRDTAGSLILAALKGGRVPALLRGELARLIAPGAEAASAEAGWQGLVDAAANDENVRAAMIAAAEKQVALRADFAAGKHAEVLASTEGLSVESAGDETVLLATLSAASAQDATAWSRWSTELVRRNPQPEVLTWIAKIRREAGL